MEAFPDSERRQERRFNRKGVAMNIHCEVAKRLTEMIHHSYDQLQLYHTTLYVSDCTVFFYVAYNFN
jgi:hypothetical protein